MTKSEHALEALDRAENGESWSNYPAIFAGFQAKGISEADILPRENVFTFNAWIAKGRVVKRGEHGVKVVSWIPIKDKDTGEVTGKRPRSAAVFHISQTVELPERKARPSAEATQTYAAQPKTESTDRWIEG